MANALHRTTKQYLQSVDTPAYPVIDWIIDPNLSAVTGFDVRYWKITGNVVSLMTLAERTAVDTAINNANRDAIANSLDFVDNVERATLLVLLDELNSHADKFNALFAAIAAGTSLADLKTKVAAVGNYPQRTLLQLKTALRNKLGS
jgi:hypothetical protein